MHLATIFTVLDGSNDRPPPQTILSMKQRLVLALLLLFTALPGLANDGGLLQTGSVFEVHSSGNNLIFERSTTTNLFDKQGKLAQTLTASDIDGDGVADVLITNTLFYDGRGNLVSSIEDLDFNADGAVDSRSITIYTNLAANRSQTVTFVDNNADGTMDEIVSSTSTFDNGRLVGTMTEIDTNADGIPDFRSVGAWTYDFDNRQSFYVVQSDYFSPGVLQHVFTATYTLNDDGNPVSGVSSAYDPNSGVNITTTMTFTYDKFGNLVQEMNETLLPGPSGPAISTATATYFYSHRGAAVRGAPVQSSHRFFQGLNATSAISRLFLCRPHAGYLLNQ